MNTEIENLRALLAEAREVARAVRNAGSLPYAQWTRDQHEADSIVERIDAALAEPVTSCSSCDNGECENCFARRVLRERDEARAEVARLQKIVDDTALGINAMIQSALNHPANCSVFDNGRCTCGKDKP